MICAILRVAKLCSGVEQVFEFRFLIEDGKIFVSFLIVRRAVTIPENIWLTPASTFCADAT